MSKGLLKQMQVTSGKTAGVVARETLAMVKKAGTVPCFIKEKTAQAIQVGGKTLRIKKLDIGLRRLGRERWTILVKMGQTVFELIVRKEKMIWQRSEIKGYVRELKKCEAEIRWIRAQIAEVEESSKERIGYYKAILNLSSEEKGVRLAAMKTLEERAGKDAIPILAKRLEDPDLTVRREAVRVLHKIIDKESR